MFQHIDDRSVEFVRTELAGRSGLTPLVRNLDFASFEAVAWIPDDAPRLVNAYADGSLQSASQKSQAVLEVARHLHDKHALGRDDNIILLCQFADRPREPSRNPKDDVLKPYKSAWLTGCADGGDGELWIADSSTSSEGVLQLLADELWFPAVGILTAVDREKNIEDGDEIFFDDLSDMVCKSTVVLVGGWDATNYLVFER